MSEKLSRDSLEEISGGIIPPGTKSTKIIKDFPILKMGDITEKDVNEIVVDCLTDGLSRVYEQSLKDSIRRVANAEGHGLNLRVIFEKGSMLIGPTVEAL